MKIGIIDPGGGLRGVYSVGIYDYCLDHNITFDCGIGVSAGAANLIGFMTGEKHRNLKFYTEYPLHKEFMGVQNLINNKCFLNLDYIYNQLNSSSSKHPMNYEAVAAHPMKLQIVATDVERGMPVYFDKSAIKQDNLDALIASASIPIVCPPFPFQNHLYYDGAVSDPIPVQKAFDEGCDKVIVLLTMPRDFRREMKTDYAMIAALQMKYPKMAHAVRRRYMIYNRSLALAKKYEEEGKAIIISPKDHGVSVLSKDTTAMKKLYKQGYHDGAKIAEFLRNI